MTVVFVVVMYYTLIKGTGVALASIFSLQRSMLVSFGEMTAVNIDIFNALTGVGVCLAVVVLGINLIKKG